MVPGFTALATKKSSIQKNLMSKAHPKKSQFPRPHQPCREICWKKWEMDGNGKPHQVISGPYLSVRLSSKKKDWPDDFTRSDVLCMFREATGSLQDQKPLHLNEYMRTYMQYIKYYPLGEICAAIYTVCMYTSRAILWT